MWFSQKCCRRNGCRFRKFRTICGRNYPLTLHSVTYIKLVEKLRHLQVDIYDETPQKCIMNKFLIRWNNNWLIWVTTSLGELMKYQIEVMIPFKTVKIYLLFIDKGLIPFGQNLCIYRHLLIIINKYRWYRGMSIFVDVTNTENCPNIVGTTKECSWYYYY